MTIHEKLDTLLKLSGGTKIDASDIKSQTFSIDHNSGGTQGGFNYNQTVYTGIPRNMILYTFLHITSSKASSCNASVTGISDDGTININITMSGDCWYSVGTTYIYVVYADIPVG